MNVNGDVSKVTKMLGISAAIFTFLTQLAVLIWGASKVDSAVTVLQTTSIEIKENLVSLRTLALANRDSVILHNFRLKQLEETKK